MKSSSKIIATGVVAALIVGAAFAVTLAFAGSPLQAATTATPGTGTPGTGTPGAAGSVAQATNTMQPTPVPPRYVRVWSSMCVEGVPYTLLSVPTDVRFALVETQASSGPVQPSASLTPQANGSTAGGAGTGTPQASAGTGTPQASMGSGTGTPQASIGSTGTPQAANGAGVPVTGAQNSLGIVPAQDSCTSLGTVSGVQLIMCTGPQASKYQLYAHGSQGTETYMGQLWDCSLPNRTPSPKNGSALGTGTSMPGSTSTPVANTPTPPQPTSTP